jgi:hypothetical protein
MSIRCVLGLCLAVVAGAPAVVLAGPLDPPLGPITSTAKPLAEIEPRTPIGQDTTPGDAQNSFVITQPGSYYLTGNITAEPDKNGIRVQCEEVTIDLKGFVVRGAGPNGRLGISTAPGLALKSVSVMNGHIVGWQIGIGGVGSVVRLQNVTCKDNVIGASLVRGSVTDCVFVGNSGTGLSGDGILAERCMALDNGLIGFSLSNSHARMCTASGNAQFGFAINTNASLESCAARGNGTGFVNNAGSVSISGCVAEDNAGDGIALGGVSGVGSVRNCLARFNTGHGIRVTSGSIIEGNILLNNGAGGAGAGILATGSNNRIEGNNCVGADFGVKVDGPANVIIRNSCSGNTTDWSLVASNVFGPIIDRRTPSSPAVNGFASPGSLGSSDGNANISY